MVDKSHYFERVENYLHSANGIKPLQALEECAKMDGASDDIVDSVVNGALLDFIFDCVPAPNDSVKVYGPDGKAIYEPKKEMTFDEWVNSLTNTFHGISRERITSILDYMFGKGMLEKSYTNSCVYRGMAPIRRRPLPI